jgi:hypothetical protein
VIQKFFRDLPEHVAPAEVEKAEQSLAQHAVNLRPACVGGAATAGL